MTTSKLNITVFPKAIPLPQGKDQKNREASKCVDGRLVEIVTENDLFEAVTSYAWSPYIFEGNKRLIKNFLHADFFALDIDMGLTIDQAEKRCQSLNLTCLIAPSPSHTAGHHKFRMIFPLASRITDIDTFTATWDYLLIKFPELDQQCSDLARFFFGCNPNTDYAIFVEGDLLLPKKAKEKSSKTNVRFHTEYVSTEGFENKDVLHILYDDPPEKIPATVDYFLSNAPTGIDGGWISSLNAAVFTLAYHGIDETRVFSAIERVSPEPLDSRDVRTIERALIDGYRKSKEVDAADDL